MFMSIWQKQIEVMVAILFITENKGKVIYVKKENLLSCILALV